MPDEVGCARPTGRSLGQVEAPSEDKRPENVKEKAMSLRAGMNAPDFEAPAYHKGKFTKEKLSDHLGHWVLLCFYPGDFTFV